MRYKAVRHVSAVVTFLLLLGGCAETYRHPYKNAGDFEKDRQKCEQIARKTLAAKGNPGT